MKEAGPTGQDYELGYTTVRCRQDGRRLYHTDDVSPPHQQEPVMAEMREGRGWATHLGLLSPFCFDSRLSYHWEGSVKNSVQIASIFGLPGAADVRFGCGGASGTTSACAGIAVCCEVDCLASLVAPPT